MDRMEEEKKKIFEELSKMDTFDEKEAFLDDLMDFPRSDLGQRLMRTELQTANLSEEELVSPDTYGVECIFLEFFPTEQMIRDFDLIARDFFEHEYQNLDQYHELTYVEEQYDTIPPRDAFRNTVLNLMFNAYKKGSAFAKAQFQYLYKKYYKKEYNQLKRFRRIELDYLTQYIYNSDTDIQAWVAICRVLTIGRIFDIEIPENCSFLIFFLNDMAKDILTRDYDPGFGIERDLRDRAGQVIRETFGSETKLLEEANEAESLIADISDYLALSPVWILDCEDPYQNMIDVYSIALALYMGIGEDPQELSEREIHLIAALYRTISVLADTSDEAYSQVHTLIRDPEFPFSDDGEDHLYDADRIQPAPERTEEATRRPVAESEEKKVSPQTEQAQQNEINLLRERVHSLENNEKSYLEAIAKKDKQLKENEILLAKQREEHDELVALRDYVYQLTEEDDEPPKISVEEMSAAIAPRRIVIIGGHDNWVNKMKNAFPAWSFISREVSGVADKDIVKNAEKVYFFTDSLAHSVYYRYMNLVREGKVPFGYIHGVNINRNVEQIYREML